MSQLRMIRKLSQLGSQEPGIVVKIKLPAPEAERLSLLGLHIGSMVRVLNGCDGKSILLAVGDTRIGVNLEVAQQIYVH